MIFQREVRVKRKRNLQDDSRRGIRFIVSCGFLQVFSNILSIPQEKGMGHATVTGACRENAW